MSSENQEIIYKRFGIDPKPGSKRLRIIHFNDVYNIDCSKKEPVGGAARFQTLLNELNKNKDSLVVFSGDAFSPSTCKNIKDRLFLKKIIFLKIGSHKSEYICQRKSNGRSNE